MSRTVVGSHARALTVKALGVPTGRGALLMLFIELNNVDLSELPKGSFNEFVKPGNGDIPAFEFGVPIGLVALLASNPFKVARCVRDAQEHRFWADLAVDNGDCLLAPDFKETRVLCVHR
jgi:hypothetical protein